MRTQARKRVLDLLDDTGMELSTNNVAMMTGRSYSAVRVMLVDLHRQHIIDRRWKRHDGVSCFVYKSKVA